MSSDPTVFVVDDEAAIRDSLRWLISTVDLNVETYSNAREFLDAYDPARPGCLILDVRLPGMRGLDLQRQMGSSEPVLPVIMMTGYGDVAPAVTAMKAGAVDFIEKPVNDQLLLDRVQESIAMDARRRQNFTKKRQVTSRFTLLTPREHEVMEMVVAGYPNKVIAAEMLLSQKTVEAHRAQVMRKTGAESLAHLVRLAQVANGDPDAAEGILNAESKLCAV